MGNSTKGWASMSEKRLKELSSKGGKMARFSPKKSRYSNAQARLQGAKGVATRMRNLAAEARVRLTNFGFSPDAIAALKLTDKEIIYYGGRTSTETRRDELQVRIDNHLATPIVTFPDIAE